MIAWLNGRLVAPADLTISFADAGFVAAATVTDFCRTYRHRLFRWPDHLARFRRDCETLRIPLEVTDTELTEAAERLAAERAGTLPPDDDLAVITFATPGPLGYLLGTHANGPPTVGMHTLPLAKDRYRRFFADGVALALAGVHPDGGLIPTGVKHRSRLHWYLADAAVRDPADARFAPGAVAVLTRPDGTAPDTAVGNVLIVRGDTVVRPRAGTVLEGVSLGVVGELCERIGLRLAEADFPFPPDADEVLFAGSGFGVAGVRAVVANGDRREFPWPGPACLRLQAAWSDLVGFDVVGQMLG